MSPSRSQSHAFARRRLPDDAVGSAMADGEEPARPDLETLYRQHADAVATWARRFGGPDFDVEDIVQEVFLVVQRRLPEWRGEAKITTWLYEITFRAVQERRRRWRWLRLRPTGSALGERPSFASDELAQLAGDEPDALALLERREATAALYQLLEGIGEKYRTVIVLFELEGRSGEQIAALTRTSLANVWIRLHRARQKLMKRFLHWEGKAKP
ncbi:MAG TPA: sigma-70 family RNA polymerase sigma factor [Polyangia bacterium]